MLIYNFNTIGSYDILMKLQFINHCVGVLIIITEFVALALAMLLAISASLTLAGSVLPLDFATLDSTLAISSIRFCV